MSLGVSEAKCTKQLNGFCLQKLPVEVHTGNGFKSKPMKTVEVAVEQRKISAGFNPKLKFFHEVFSFE